MSGFLTKAAVKRELLDTVKARKLAYYGHTMRKQGSCLEKEIMKEQCQMHAGEQNHAQHQDVDKTPCGRVNQNQRENIEMEKVRPWCDQPSARGRLQNRTGCIGA